MAHHASMPVDKPDVLDFGANSATSSYLAGPLILPSAIQFSRIYDRRNYKKASAPVDALAEQCPYGFLLVHFVDEVLRAV